jgi:hypothetical protein
MSDSVICDVCQRAGRRKVGATAPEGWYFVELQDDVSLEVHIIYACSAACTRLPWQRGPGRLSEGLQPGVKATQVRRPVEVARLQAALDKLAKQAATITAGYVGSPDHPMCSYARGIVRAVADCRAIVTDPESDAYEITLVARPEEPQS